ncbi:hypothetical protein Cylst_2291 [Cylindrospermum stagnale PCC 7417]|uniref:Uncharacterized protein n=1 Tax=Cylindrospermum stagnale PCC 7417 TaxID=56107 RepID=K9WXJ3_9NOST|nr:hypothetical protein [Cylindrospermum stagnale]AFZ24521.1 hypothetical protein Cylst_2291 [Cylindrospermum stagnale PCC 7417]
MLNEIVTVYCLVDDLLKTIGHREDTRREMSDAEIITTAIIAAMFFSGNHSQACSYMKDHNLTPLSQSNVQVQQNLHIVT